MTDDNNNHIDSELTPEERQRFDGLPRAMTPPPELEGQVIQRLRNSGLLVRRPRWWVGASAVAASVVMFIAGYAFGARTDRDTVSLPLERQYVLLLYETAEFDMAPTEDPNQVVREYSRWAEEIFDRGIYAGGERLAEYGFVLAGSEDGIDVDARLLEAPEGILGGYFVIYAVDDEDALDIARTHPHLRRGGAIAVRAIDPVS